MDYPEVILATVLEIIRIGIRNIRVHSHNGEMQKCATEARHIHNLPRLLIRFSNDELGFYLRSEKSAFIRNMPSGSFEEFEPYWKVLQDFLDSQTEGRESQPLEND